LIALNARFNDAVADNQGIQPGFWLEDLQRILPPIHARVNGTAENLKLDDVLARL